MARLTPREVAQKFALRGEIDSAVEALLSLKQKGDIGANASLAEIAAYRAKWKDVFECSEVVLAAPSALDTLNVYTDTVLLVARAGVELKAWAEVQRLAKFGASKLVKRDADEEKLDAVRNLLDFAKRKGKGPYVADEEPEARRKEKFEAALEKLAQNKKKRFKTAADRLDHLYGLASVYGYHGGAVSVYDQEKAWPALFQNIEFAASALARCGRKAEAWKAIESNIHQWWPVAETQIVPVALVTDEALRPLMTRERCEKVLHTRRGPEA
jgi:hypothetical protein